LGYKKKRGFSLLEVVAAAGLMMVLSIGLFALWQNSIQQTEAIRARQNAYENARIAVDGLLRNIQMAYIITLTVDSNDNLNTLIARGINREDARHNFRFDFNINATPTMVQYYRRLVFGQNEFANGIASVVITVDCEIDPSRMYVTVTTLCEIELHGSADVRYKDVTLLRQ